MGGDSVMTKPSVLRMEDDVKELLDKAGILDFFQKFIGFSESISLGFRFIAEGRIDLPRENKLAKESLPTPWDRVAIQVTNYLTLEGKGKFPLHQGLLKMLVNCERARNILASLTLKGNLIRTSGTPVSKAQLLLGPTSSSPKIGDDFSNLGEEEDNPSEDARVSIMKIDDSRK
eukprot:Gb_30224 [translate_table: standard]